MFNLPETTCAVKRCNASWLRRQFHAQHIGEPGAARTEHRVGHVHGFRRGPQVVKDDVFHDPGGFLTVATTSTSSTGP